MSKLGENISRLIDINIQIWHKASKMKDINNELRTDIAITPKERVDHFFEVRKLNTERSAIRWEIDKDFGGANESKVDFYQESEEC